MDAKRPMTRRDVARGIAVSAVAALPCPSFAQGAARIVVIGGGFGGASCARALRKLDQKLQVSLIEPNQTFTACPFSNEVIVGMRELPAQQFNYDKIAAAGGIFVVLVWTMMVCVFETPPAFATISTGPTARGARYANV